MIMTAVQNLKTILMIIEDVVYHLFTTNKSRICIKKLMRLSSYQQLIEKGGFSENVTMCTRNFLDMIIWTPQQMVAENLNPSHVREKR